MAAFWDVVGKAANLFQLFGGLDAITLITIATSFLRFHEMSKERRKLEERVRMLRVLLHSPSGCWIMQQRQNLELGHLVTNALRDAHDLIESYNGSTLLARVRRGRSMAARVRDLRRSIDSYCGLILSVDVFLLAAQASRPPPPSLVGQWGTATSNDVGSMPPSTGDSVGSDTSAAAAPGDSGTHIIDIYQE